MKIKDINKGELVTRSDTILVAEIIEIGSNGLITVKSYFDNCNHYINAHKIQKLNYKIEKDDGSFHGYVPMFKGLHTCGNSEAETVANLKDALKAYILSMKKHSEFIFKSSTWYKPILVENIGD
ncbi:MAG: type II toxin-antitoxin system HicB family antitoxin [Lutibacter sp.]|jgi:predicted RNase H-like HicB family nuclease